MRAERLEERTEANVASASTSVPPAVASDAAVGQLTVAPTSDESVPHSITSHIKAQAAESRCGAPRASSESGSTRISGANTVHGRRGTVA